MSKSGKGHRKGRKGGDQATTPEKPQLPEGTSTANSRDYAQHATCSRKNSNCRRPLSSLIFKVAAVISSFHPRDRRQVLEEIDGKSKSTERGGAAIQEKPDENNARQEEKP